jgi:lysozyme family protein
MANFNISKEKTKSFEGGYWNDPSAGITYAGITTKYYPTWAGFARIRQLTNNKAPKRYTIFKDQLLNQMVFDFYKNIFWDKKVYGQLINNQDLANMCYDFILHKENAAINVINNVALSINKNIKIGKTFLSKDVLAVMNAQPEKFYTLLRAARIEYYLTPGKFSTELAQAFVDRVEKLPEIISVQKAALPTALFFSSVI